MSVMLEILNFDLGIAWACFPNHVFDSSFARTGLSTSIWIALYVRSY